MGSLLSPLKKYITSQIEHRYHVMELILEVVFMDKKPNRLINEKSPYLLQHAYNPIDWYTWSVEAFEQAKKEDKPIFLSIGYGVCHWCHVH
ncbi:hypothetical protein SPACI_048530 [Sporomusa acidovorans DSM 3132]|uniref:Spermatogenesis-associated protein 20-like TRX domain-containing protein n=2 Tax=Sporomusa TaxID=2375 RepID=A0ABZ3JA29_SPOA4|nr:hypothetical protein SPACI_44990 [Sporomusa acidovorans DSM 3132]SDF83016.1 Protein of unknown function, DUF255 [Sporomusa acidovorans]